MIDLDSVISIHRLLIREFGGSEGIRDMPILESAVNRPFQTFNKQDLYPTIVGKATALVESIVKNHPFIDGNKRTGYVLMRFFLLENELDIKADEEEKYKFVINIASGKLSFQEIESWIKDKL